jgi:hypothetical protein
VRADEMRRVLHFPGFVFQTHHTLDHNFDEVEVRLGTILKLKFFDNAL